MNENLKHFIRPLYNFATRFTEAVASLFQHASRNTSEEARHYEIPMPPGLSFSHLSIKLTVPAPPDLLINSFRFSHHVLDTNSEEASDCVLAATQGGYFFSSDLGKTWELVTLSEFRTVRFVNAYQLSNGNILLQSSGPSPKSPIGTRDVGVLVLHGPQGTYEVGPVPGRGQWHGTSSIDEKDGVLMFADYQLNGAIDGPERMASHVFRSLDGGQNWKTVFELPGLAVRHLHFLRADPIEPKTWWLSSGDSPSESRIWQSKDDGESWTDLTIEYVKDVPVGKRRMKRTVFRLTDMVFHNGGVIWGTDDIIGELANLNPNLSLSRRSGARVFFAKRANSLVPQSVGYCGQAIRNIVDCGKFWLVISQGRIFENFTRPRVFLLEKETLSLVHLFDVDRHEDTVTGFTYSIASRKAKDGVFFTYRARGDVFKGRGNILRWDIEVS